MEEKNVEGKKRKNGFGTAGLVLGIVGICTSFIPIINNLSFVMGLIAIIFGIVGIVQKANKGFVITAIILGILSIVITINAQQSFSDSINKSVDEINNEMNNIVGDSTEDILANYADVSLGEFQVIKGEYYDETKMVVKVTNKASETKSFSIQVEAIDASGSRITQDYIYANNLGAGQSQDFEIFTYTSSDKLDAMQNATFKIVEVSMY